MLQTSARRRKADPTRPYARESAPSDGPFFGHSISNQVRAPVPATVIRASVDSQGRQPRMASPGRRRRTRRQAAAGVKGMSPGKAAVGNGADPRVPRVGPGPHWRAPNEVGTWRRSYCPYAEDAPSRRGTRFPVPELTAANERACPGGTPAVRSPGPGRPALSGHRARMRSAKRGNGTQAKASDEGQEKTPAERGASMSFKRSV